MRLKAPLRQNLPGIATCSAPQRSRAHCTAIPHHDGLRRKSWSVADEVHRMLNGS